MTVASHRAAGVQHGLSAKVAELYRYRALLSNLVVTELKLRYRRSALGFFWSLLNPLLMMTVLTLVFSTVMRFNIEDYAVLLLAGIVPWGFFAQSVGLSLMSVVSKGSLLKKVYVPKAVIPLSAVLATMVNFVLSLVPLLILVAAMGRPMNSTILFLPVSIAILTLFTCGFAFLFSCLNVFFRDFGHMTEVILQAWFYASPIIYTVEMVPEKYQHFFMWNPMYSLIELFRAPVYRGELPGSSHIWTATLVATITAVVGLGVFWRFENKFVFKV